MTATHDDGSEQGRIELEVRCLAKGHLVAQVERRSDGRLWLLVPRPTTSVPRQHATIGHDRKGSFGRLEQDLSAMLAEFDVVTMSASCGCAVDFELTWPTLLDRAHEQERTTKVFVEPHHWRPPRAQPTGEQR